MSLLDMNHLGLGHQSYSQAEFSEIDCNREKQAEAPLKTVSLVLSSSVGSKCSRRDHIPSKQISHIPSFVAWTSTWIPNRRSISEPPEGLFKITYLLACILKCSLDH